MEDYVVTFKSGRIVYISVNEFRDMTSSNKNFVAFHNGPDPYLFINMNEIESIKLK